MRLLLIVTVKAGCPSVSSSGPARVERGAAGADETTSRTGAAVGQGSADCRSRKTGLPASSARRCNRRVAVKSSRSGLP